MSRIGKLPISIPAGVTVNFDANSNVVTVKGPKGELSQKRKHRDNRRSRFLSGRC